MVSYQFIPYRTDLYHIVPNGWPQGTLKVGASFNRKVPSDKKEQSSDGVATMEVYKQQATERCEATGPFH